MKKTKSRDVSIISKEPRFQVINPDNDYGPEGAPQPESYYDLQLAFSKHVWVFRCVKAISDSIAGVDILPYQKKKDGSYVVDEQHDFYDLLQSPNAYMSGYMLRQYTAAALALTGNAYWALERLGTRDVKEIWPLLSDSVRAVSTKDKMIDHYVQRVGGVNIRFEYDEIIHFRDVNPNSYIYGQGSLGPAKNTVATDIFAQVWNKAFFKNSARPEGTLETVQTLNDDVRKRVRRAWEQMHQGAEKHGRTAILEGGLSYKTISESTKDMDFVNLRKDLRIEILAAFGVPPSIVGLLEFANYSNMAQQSKTFWDATLLPQLKNISETLTLRARQLTFRAGTVFQADTDKVEALQTNKKEQADMAKTYVDMGIPVNQVIDALDLPFEHVEGGDVPRAPAQPFGSQPSDPNAPKPAPAAVPPKAAKNVVVADMREIKRGQAWKRLDERVREHEGRMRTAMSGFFSGQKRRILKSLDQRAATLVRSVRNPTKATGDTVDLIFNIDRENELMKKPADRIIRGAYFDFAITTARRLAPEFDFSLTDPYAERWIQDKVSKLVLEANSYTLEQISQETADAVQEAVAAGFSESETIDQVADRIRAVYDFALETRADRIARTEIIGATNAGSFEAMKKTGVEKKEWLATRDEKTRETHQELDGQIVGINEGFQSSSGAVLQYPGDPNGPASEVVNCRCRPISAGSED